MSNRGPNQRVEIPDRERLRELQLEDEEEALRKAIEESFRMHAPYEGYNHATFFPNANVAPTNDVVRPSTVEDEEEQLRRAIAESLKPPPAPVVTDPNAEEAAEILKLIAQIDNAERKAVDPIVAPVISDASPIAPVAVVVPAAPHSSVLDKEALVIQKMIADMETSKKKVIDVKVEADPAINNVPASPPKKTDSLPKGLPSQRDGSEARRKEEGVIPQKRDDVGIHEVVVPSTATASAAAIESDEEDIVPEPEINPAVIEEPSMSSEPVVDPTETSDLQLSIPVQSIIVDEEATVVSEDENEDDWELVPTQAGELEGTVLLEECHSDSEDDSSIAEPDLIIRTSPLRTSQQSSFAEEVAKMSSSKESQKSSADDEFDPVLAHAHELLERSGFMAIEKSLQDESDEFIESLLREHEQDLQSSVLSSGTRQGGLLSSIEEVQEDDPDEFSSVISDHGEDSNELFQSAHSTLDHPVVAEVTSVVPVAVPSKSQSESHLTASQLKALSPADNALRCPPDVFALLKRGKYQFERVHGVKVGFSNSKDCVVTVHHSDPDIESIALSELQSIIRDSDQFEQQLLTLKSENTHIFVDNSNIFIGSQIVGIDKKTKKFIYDHSLRLNHRALDRVVNNERNCQRKFVVGSTEHGDAQTCVWAQLWERVGYKVYLHPFSSEGKESVVDSSLIAEITIHLGNIDRQRSKGPSKEGILDTLVLLTGDGNNNQGNASLFATVEHALGAGWNVELWCWRLSASKNYRRLADQYSSSGRFRLSFLDNYRDEIMFKKQKQGPNNNKTTTKQA